MSITLLGQTCIDSFICLFECFSWKKYNNDADDNDDDDDGLVHYFV